MFHAGVAIAAIAGAGLRPAALWLSLLGPVTFISIMLAATRSLESRQLAAYGNDAAFRAYLSDVPRLFPIGTASAAP